MRLHIFIIYIQQLFSILITYTESVLTDIHITDEITDYNKCLSSVLQVYSFVQYKIDFGKNAGYKMQGYSFFNTFEMELSKLY
jgi:hypothetical protein